jgi:hypothetical protein
LLRDLEVPDDLASQVLEIATAFDIREVLSRPLRGGHPARVVALNLASDRVQLLDALFDAMEVAMLGKRGGIEYPDNESDREADAMAPSAG